MEPPRAPAPRPRPSPAPSPSHVNLISSSPQLVNFLRQNVLQSPLHFNSPLLHGNHHSTSLTDINGQNKNHNEAANASTFSPFQSTSNDASQNKSSSLDKINLTPQTNKISGDITYTPTYGAYAPSQNPGSVPNPHSTIVPSTPIISGPNQAKNSIKLQNCVSTVNLQCELKLLDIYCKTRFSEYNPSRFHGVVMRILEPRATALVFRSGKVVCTGAKNEHDSLLATRKFSKIIKKLGFPVRFSEFKIQNLVATADLRFPIKLETLQQAHGQFTSYEPELFPGLIYRLIRPRIVLLIFVNGKIVFTGAKSRDDIVESLNIIYPILRSFKKN